MCEYFRKWIFLPRVSTRLSTRPYFNRPGPYHEGHHSKWRLYESNTTAFDVTPQCSARNHTYSPFESLAMYYACTDLTDKLTLSISSDGLSNFSALLNSLSLQSQWSISAKGLIQMTVNNSAIDQLESIAFKGYGYPLVDMFVILAPYE
jgi:hypothetical protein